MNIEKVYERGIGLENEDYYVINNDLQIYGVLDGATSLNKRGFGGRLASETLGNHFEINSEEVDLWKLLKKGNEELGILHLQRYGVKTYDEISKIDRSTTGLAVVKIGIDKIDFVQCGDCMLLGENEDGEVILFSEDKLYDLDKCSLLKLEEIYARKGKIDRFEDDEVLEVLIKNRNLFNTENGYPIVDGSDECLSYIVNKTIDKKGLKRLLLLSDGLMLPFESTENVSNEEIWKATGAYVFHNGLDSLLKLITHLEESDSECTKYKRFKKHDDKTGLLIEL